MWLTLDDKDLENNGTDVELDELQLYGGAQLAILNPANAKARISIVIGQMQGDRYVLSVSNSHNVSRSVCVIICLLKSPSNTRGYQLYLAKCREIRSDNNILFFSRN